MRLAEIQNKINELLSQFVTEVRGANAAGRTDINRAAETLLIPLLGEVYGWKHLVNLNSEENENFPAIDLGDKEAGVAIQVTSTSNSEKIKETLQKFRDKELFRNYPRIYFYILTEKQASYSSKAFNEISKGFFEFDSKKHILDYRDVFEAVTGFTAGRAEKVLAILEENISHARPLSREQNFKGESPSEKREEVALNLFEVTFPGTLYVGEIIPEILKEISKSKRSKPFSPRKRGWKSKRDLVREVLGKFAVDWEIYENKIVTFHDLRDSNLPTSQIIDVASAESLSPDEFYEQDSGQENIFKSLLRKCLQQMLYRRQLAWQNDRHLFIFVDRNGEDERKEKWKGKVSAERTVFERVANYKDAKKTAYYKHLAFEPRFLFFGGKWYLSIRPDWFFSSDKYKESYYAADKLSWLKRQENNDQVHHQLQFLHYFLASQPQPELFGSRAAEIYPFLSFGDLIKFDNSLYLPDKEWNPPDSKVDEKQMVLDL